MLRVIVGCEVEEAQRGRPLVVRAYDEARRRDWPFLSDVLEGSWKEASEEDRAIAAAAVQALVKYDRLLAFATGSGSADAKFDALFALARGETQLGPRIDRIENATER